MLILFDSCVFEIKRSVDINFAITYFRKSMNS